MTKDNVALDFSIFNNKTEKKTLSKIKSLNN